MTVVHPIIEVFAKIKEMNNPIRTAAMPSIIETFPVVWAMNKPMSIIK